MRERIKKLLICLCRFLPLRNDIIMESHPDFSDNTFALFQYFLKQGVNKRCRIYWALHNREQKLPELPENVDTFYLDARGIRQMTKRFFALYRSRFIIDCNTYIQKRRKGQIRLHLGHGMLIKIAKGYHTAEKIGECDGYLVTSPFWYDTFVKKIGLPEKVLLPLGYPRNDVLVSLKAGQSRFGKYAGKYLVWMPTYRQHRSHMDGAMESRYPYGMPEVMKHGELLALDKLLAEKGMILYFRPHPVQELSLIRLEELEQIKIADDDFLHRAGITLYEMLAGAQGLITDYSSVYYDFLLTGRPIGLTIGDREEYFNYYDCPFEDMKEAVRGSYIESFTELTDFICSVAAGENPEIEELAVMRERYHAVQDGSSSEKIYRYLQENYNFDRKI